MPFYIFNDFKKCCKNNKDLIIPINDVLKDANKHFNLRTKTMLLNFIANNGCEELKFINTKKYRKDRNKKNPMLVDGYKFKSNNILGYLAFMKSKISPHWFIKSFHPDDDENSTSAISFNKAKRITMEKKNG